MGEIRNDDAEQDVSNDDEQFKDVANDGSKGDQVQPHNGSHDAEQDMSHNKRRDVEQDVSQNPKNAEHDVSHDVDSPPKKPISVVPISSDAVEPIRADPVSVVEPTDSSCKQLTTNTEIQEKATKKKADTLFLQSRPVREKHAAAVKLSPFVNPVKVNPFIEVNQEKLKLLDEWLAEGQDKVFPTGSAQSAPEFFEVLRKPRAWLWNFHIDCYLNVLRLRLKNRPELFPNTRIAFLDTAFTMNWREKHKIWVKNNELHPGGSFDYLNGDLPAYAKIKKWWDTDVDILYAVLFVGNNHWVALVISIRERTIEVLDSGIANTKDEDMKKAVEPFAQMVPHLLWYVASPLDKALMSAEPYDIRPRSTNLPVNGGKQGDCGVYALKFIECSALGIQVPRVLNDRNMRKIRDKMAVDMFEETFKYGASESALDVHASLNEYCNSVEFLNQC